MVVMRRWLLLPLVQRNDPRFSTMAPIFLSASLVAGIMFVCVITGGHYIPDTGSVEVVGAAAAAGEREVLMVV